MKPTLTPIPFGNTRLLPSLFQQRYNLNRRYMLSLKTENLLQNHYMEAGLWGPSSHPIEPIHWGWESPTCQVRGHFLGHWLSGAAYMIANNNDQEVKGKADHMINELARCQRENGGEWVGSIPEKYLHWVALGKSVWAPHYTLHKTLMGLWDMYHVGGNQQALEILLRWTHWFHRWSGQFTLEQMDDILDVETGGMLEIWANLYGVTGDKQHLDLIARYDRRRLFDPLRAGQDMLTNMHMNTTIPELHGAARAWEVTGDSRWREIVEAYWRLGVSERGCYVTGGQTNGEVWSPPQQLSARLGFRTQEHCTVYNMQRLAEYLYRWTGDPQYADYWERALWNGIVAQQHPDTGQIAYFLPLHAGAQKTWGSETEDFWCCHGSLVQVHTRYANAIAYSQDKALTLAQWVPSEVVWESDGVPVTLRITAANLKQSHRPDSLDYQITVSCPQPRAFTLRLRMPWWISSVPEASINGQPVEAVCSPSSYLEFNRTWSSESLQLRLPKALVSVPLPDDPTMLAFMDGPVVLAGLNPGAASSKALSPKDGSHTARKTYTIDGLSLRGDPANPGSFLIADNEREWGNWMGTYRTTGQAHNFRLIPLYEVRDEVYTVYFEMKAGA